MEWAEKGFTIGSGMLIVVPGALIPQLSCKLLIKQPPIMPFVGTAR